MLKSWPVKSRTLPWRQRVNSVWGLRMVWAHLWGHDASSHWADDGFRTRRILRVMHRKTFANVSKRVVFMLSCRGERVTLKKWEVYPFYGLARRSPNGLWSRSTRHTTPNSGFSPSESTKMAGWHNDLRKRLSKPGHPNTSTPEISDPKCHLCNSEFWDLSLIPLRRRAVTICSKKKP